MARPKVANSGAERKEHKNVRWKPRTTLAAASLAAHQRARILQAAEQCFIDTGFHSASVPQIASRAVMSVGLIYRYFRCKDDIVNAVIERQVNAECYPTIERWGSPDDACDALLDVFDRWRCTDDPTTNAGLFLNAIVECTREPTLARTFLDKDRITVERLTLAVQRIARGRGVALTSTVAHGRAELLQCLVEGMASRSVRDPKLQRADLNPGLTQIVNSLFK
jgi:AcrR family transcriptional regulator